MELPGNDLKGIVSKFKPKYVAPVEQPEVTPQQPSQNDEIEQRLRGLGYTQDDINTYFSPDPNTPIYEQIYRNTIKEPKPLSEKGARAARTVAGIGDSLGLLSQVFGASRGAHVGPIQNSSVAYQANDERNMRNLYSKELDQYNAGLAGAQGADAQIQLAEKRALRNKMLEGLSAYEKRQQELADKGLRFEQWKAEMGYKQAKDAKEDAKWKKEYEQRERHNKATENKEKDKKFEGIVINANQADPNATSDAMGNRVVKIKMNKQEILNLANTAKNDAEFMARHPELLIDKPNMFGSPTKGLTSDQEIAWAYAQEKYNSRYTQEKPKVDIPYMFKVPQGKVR